jgi:hypothetical protein
MNDIAEYVRNRGVKFTSSAYMSNRIKDIILEDKR